MGKFYQNWKRILLKTDWLKIRYACFCEEEHQSFSWYSKMKNGVRQIRGGSMAWTATNLFLQSLNVGKDRHLLWIREHRPHLHQGFFHCIFFSVILSGDGWKKNRVSTKSLKQTIKLNSSVMKRHKQCFKNLEFVGTTTPRSEHIFSSNCLCILWEQYLIQTGSSI